MEIPKNQDRRVLEQQYNVRGERESGTELADDYNREEWWVV